MLKTCKYCGRIHDSKHDCGKKPKRKKLGNEKDRFRWSQAWQRKRKDIKRRDLYLCQTCKAEHRYVYNDLEVHHIEPLEERFDLRLTNENLITLCRDCHELAERGKIHKKYLVMLVRVKYLTPPHPSEIP